VEVVHERREDRGYASVLFRRDPSRQLVIAWPRSGSGFRMAAPVPGLLPSA